MLKKVAILSLVTSIIFSCSIDNPFSADTKSSINSSFGELDITKKVEIKILNPTNKSTAEWYKKNDKTVIMKIGSSAEIQGTAILKDETKSSNVTWSSSDNTIAVVNNGKIAANKLGTTTILATSNLDSSYKGILNVEVVDEANFASSDSKSINSVKSVLAYVDISNKKYSSLAIGINQSISASASVTLLDSTKNGNVLWESSDENIATVDADGKITAKRKGEITIVAKYKLYPDAKALINLEVSDIQAIIGKLLANPTINNSTSSENNINLNDSLGLLGTWCLTANYKDFSTIVKGTVTINKKLTDENYVGQMVFEPIKFKNKNDTAFKYTQDMNIIVERSITSNKVYLKFNGINGKITVYKGYAEWREDKFLIELSTSNLPNSIKGDWLESNGGSINLDKSCGFITDNNTQTLVNDSSLKPFK